jgi:hypothetical protein
MDLSGQHFQHIGLYSCHRTAFPKNLSTAKKHPGALIVLVAKRINQIWFSNSSHFRKTILPYQDP